MRLSLLPPIVAIAVFPPSVWAEDIVPVVDEATLIASLESDPRFERIAAQIDESSAGVEAARIRPEPRVAADREQVFPSGGSVSTNYLRVVVPVDLSGRRTHLVNAAAEEADATRARADLTRWNIVIEGLRTYREAAYLRLRVTLMADERDALVRAVDIVAKRAMAGEASGYDQQRLQLELGTYDDAIASARIELVASQRRLATIVGRAGGRVDAAGDLAVGAVSSLEALAGDSLARRGDYRAAQRRVAAAEAATAAAGRLKVPTFELSAGAMSTDIGTEQVHGFVAGLSLNLPIFNRGQAERARAQAERRGAIADMKLLERDVPQSILIAHETWSARVAQAVSFRSSQVARIEQLLRSAETAYREGGGSIVELLDAYRTARDARLRELDLRRDASLAELDLWLTLGRRP